MVTFNDLKSLSNIPRRTKVSITIDVGILVWSDMIVVYPFRKISRLAHMAMILVKIGVSDRGAVLFRAIDWKTICQ